MSKINPTFFDTNGIVYKWKLDGDGLADFGGLDLTGTNITNNIASTGFNSKSSVFNGSSSSFTNGTVLDTNLTAWSCEFWFKLNGTTQQYFIDREGTGGTVYGIMIIGNWTTTGNIGISWSGGVFGQNTYTTSGLSLNDGKWHHFVGFGDSSGRSSVGMYIDGKPEGTLIGTTGGNTGSILTDTSKDFFIGKRYNNGLYLNGEMNNVVFYNYVLNENQITNLYLQGVRKYGPTHIAPYTIDTRKMKKIEIEFYNNAENNISSLIYTDDIKVYDDYNNLIYSNDLESGLDGTWTIGAATSISQSSDIAKTGTYSRKVSMTDPGAVASISYVSRDIDIGNNGSRFESRHYISNMPDDDNIYYIGDVTNSFYVGFEYKREAASQMYWFKSDVGIINSGISLSTGQWYKFEVNFNGASSTLKMYNSSETQLASYTWDNGKYSGYFKKYSLPNLRDGLVLDLPAKAVSGTYYDYSGNGNNSSSVTAVTDSSYGLNNIMSFNGSTSYISITDFEYNMATSFTYNAWIKINNYTDFNGIIEQDASSTSSRGVLFRTKQTTGVLNFIRLNSTPTVATDISSPFAVPLSTWTMVTATFDNTVGSKIYINGIKVASDTVLTNTNNSTTPINIGAREIGTTNFMDGQIIDPQIWNRALSAQEVQQLYNSNFIFNP